MVILLVKIYGFFKWMIEDYGQVPAYRIEEEAARMAGEEPQHQAPRSAAAVH
ncbi:putative transporter [compost metagenome]